MLGKVLCRNEIFQGKLAVRGIVLEAHLAADRLLWGHHCTCTGKTPFLDKWVPWKTLSGLPAPWAGLGLLPPEMVLMALVQFILV